MRRIAAIAATLAVLSGCGGEDKTKASKPERAATTDWRGTADGACGRATDALVSRGWANDLKQMRRRLPAVVRDVRTGIGEIRNLSGRPDQQFVAAMEALEPRFSELVRASRKLSVRRLDRVITRLEGDLRTLAAAARRAGLRECVQHNQARSIVNVLRAPVAAERLARIEDPIVERFRESRDLPWPDAPRGAIAALDDELAALRDLRVPAWAKREKAAYMAVARRYRRGLDEVADRYEAGLATSDARFQALVKRPERRTNRMMRRLWEGMGANPVS